MVEKVKHLVFSYVPLLTADMFGKSNPTPEMIQKKVSELYDQSKVSGCLWVSEEDGTPAACFIIENGKAIADHLLHWCENKPDKWFLTSFESVGETYGIGLFANSKMSVERYKTNHLMTHSEFLLESDCDFVVVSLPLMCLCNSAAAFERVKSRIGNSISIYILDSSAIGPDGVTHDNLTEIWESAQLIGNIPVVDTFKNNIRTALVEGEHVEQ